MTDPGASGRPLTALTRAFAHRTSLATRLSAAALTVSLTSLLALLIFTSGTLTQGADEVARQRAGNLADGKAIEIRDELALLGRQLTLLAASPTALDSIEEFTAAFAELEAGDASTVTARRSALRSFYLDEFIPSLAGVRGSSIDAQEVAPGTNVATVWLQAEYIAENPLPPGERDLYVAGDDGSVWSAAHATWHPFWQSTASRTGFADLYLIEPETRTIVYSVSKDVDFATSLDTGPYGGTELGILSGLVSLDPRPGEAVFSDLATYTPALDQPSMFVAAPVFDGDGYAGLVVARIPGTTLDAVMTRDWRAGRFGETGEAYLVGADSRMRSVSRLFAEDRRSYLDIVDDIGIDPADRRGMVAHDTTALFQKISSPVVDGAFEGTTDSVTAIGYLGVEVLAAARPVDIPGLDWVVVEEQATDEVESPVADFFRVSLIITGVFVVALTFLMVAWANRFIRPIRDLGAALGALRAGDTSDHHDIRGATEFRRLGEVFHSVGAELVRRRDDIVKAREEKRKLLGLVLPASAADSVEHGDRRLLESSPAVTVVVVVFDGLDDLVRGRTAEDNRDQVHRMLDAADSVAATNGVTRIKVMGDTYFAACGLDVPYLDHAPRAVAFARQTREAIRAVARETGLPLDVRAGVHSGPVTVGLVGGARLVYDLWGDTVTTAYRLARLAAPGQLLVSGTTRDRLPPGTEATPVGADELEAWHLTPLVPADGGTP